ncbi:MAG TPA: hypothetical protein DHN33_06020 [Eubacteriaceae bacterium]|nr:hypothetical protein [Eubacteriaceae bacterium]
MERIKLWTKDYVLFLWVNLFMNTGVQLLIPVLPLYATEVLGAHESQVGYLLGLYSFAALIARPLAGYSYDNFDRKKIFTIALVVFGVLFAFYPFISVFAFLVVMRIIHGVIFSFTTTGASTIVGDILHPIRRAEGIGFFGMTQTVAMAIGPMLAIWVIDLGQYSTLFIAGAVLLFTAVLAFRLVDYKSMKPKKRKKINPRNFFEKRVLPIAANMMLVGVGMGAIFSYVVIYSQNTLGFSGGTFFLLYALGVLVVRISSGRIIAQYGAIPIAIFGLGIQIVGLILLSMTNSTILFVVSSILLGFANGSIMPSLLAMIFDVVDHKSRGAATATFFAAMDIGIGGGSIVLGWIVDLLSIGEMFLVTGIYALIPLLLFIFYVQKDYRNKVQSE